MFSFNILFIVLHSCLEEPIKGEIKFNNIYMLCPRLDDCIYRNELITNEHTYFISSNFFKLRKLSNSDSEDTSKVEINFD